MKMPTVARYEFEKNRLKVFKKLIYALLFRCINKSLNLNGQNTKKWA